MQKINPLDLRHRRHLHQFVRAYISKIMTKYLHTHIYYLHLHIHITRNSARV